ncbi:MAG: hypothetical protein IT307_02355 [Chloroflexi bacterium]|nr:hypothetical protein [Chloroflexota bacterium]
MNYRSTETPRLLLEAASLVALELQEAVRHTDRELTANGLQGLSLDWGNEKRLPGRSASVWRSPTTRSLATSG